MDQSHKGKTMEPARFHRQQPRAIARLDWRNDEADRADRMVGRLALLIGAALLLAEVAAHSNSIILTLFAR